MSGRARAGLLILLGILLNGCLVGPNYTPPETRPPQTFGAREAFEVDGAAATSLLVAGEPEAAWWRLLGDPALDRLVGEALAANHDLRIARSNVLVARALLGEQRLEAWPITSTEASVLRQQASAETLPPGTERTATLYSAGLDAVWELDFFGRVRRSVEARGAEFEAAMADLRFVAVTVTAEVARTYLELRGAQYRLEVASRNATNQRKTYELTRALLEGGRGTDLDLARAEAQLQTTLASVPPLEAEIARAIHRLGVLVGRQPAELRDELTVSAPLPLLPDRLAIGDPTGLLRRRPDVAAAERELAAATARIGVQVADLFPRVSLTGSVGVLSLSASDLGDSGARTYSFGPFLSWPAFDLARVRRRIAAAEARAEGQLAFYEQTVLEALEEAESTLVAYARSRERQARLHVASEASARAAFLAQERYQYGVDSFLVVLDAERRLLEVQDLEARSATESAVALVAVYKALAGGWFPEEEPPPKPPPSP